MMEGKNEQARNSQGCHSGVDGASSHELPRSRNDAYQVMMGWLRPRTGKP
jgi:hypothetical protein